MDRVCNEEIWVDILSRNFSDFLNRLRDELKDDLEIYFYLSYRFHSFIFDNLSLYSVFAHFTLCKRRCNKKETHKRFCNFCSRITPQIFDKEHNFNDIIINERDFTREFNDFFYKKNLFSLDICRGHSLFVNTKKAKIFGCTYFEDIKSSSKLFRVFVSILIRAYLNCILSLLNEVEFSEYQATFFRQEVWSYAGSLFYDFCLHVNIDYFNVLFRDIKPEQYKSNCFKIINKHLVVDLT